MQSKDIKTVTFTGNRGISHKNPTVIESLHTIHHCAPDAVWRSGMAMGIDLIAAKYAYYHQIPFEAHLPFPAEIQTKLWNESNKSTHEMLLKKAVRIVTHTKEFSIDGYQIRNEGMASGADIIVAFNLNERGGTVNMINYCLSKNMTVLDGFDDLKVMKNV